MILTIAATWITLGLATVLVWNIAKRHHQGKP